MFWLALWKVRLGGIGRIRALGRSMEPVIPSGSRLTIEPVNPERIELGDIVMARVARETMLHLVKAIDREGRRVEISGTRGPADGWTPFERVYGICTRIGKSAVPGAKAKSRRPRS
jgi:Peptidase S24-like